MDKTNQRQQHKKIRNGIPQKIRAQYSEQILAGLLNCPEWEMAPQVLSYSSFGSEVETRQLNEMILQSGKKLYLPKTDMGLQRMQFYEVSSLAELVSGYQGILEPSGDEVPYKPVKDDIIIVPGLAFDRQNNRMGYGGGYYDRFLAKEDELISIMLAFEEQATEILITEPTDVKIKWILTQNGLQGCAKNTRKNGG